MFDLKQQFTGVLKGFTEFKSDAFHNMTIVKCTLATIPIDSLLHFSFDPCSLSMHPFYSHLLHMHEVTQPTFFMSQQH